MKQINLRKDEISYLFSAKFLSEKQKSILEKKSKKINSNYLLTISEEIADEMRDLFCEEIEVIGFDENYHLSAEGKILESLIDKFFCE